MADVCMAMKVKHIVFNAQSHVSKVIGVKARHYDAKAYINDYMNERELPLTSVILPFAYENFLGEFKPEKYQQHEYTIGRFLACCLLLGADLDSSASVILFNALCIWMNLLLTEKRVNVLRI